MANTVTGQRRRQAALEREQKKREARSAAGRASGAARRKKAVSASAKRRGAAKGAGAAKTAEPQSWDELHLQAGRELAERIEKAADKAEACAIAAAENARLTSKHAKRLDHWSIESGQDTGEGDLSDDRDLPQYIGVRPMMPDVAPDAPGAVHLALDLTDGSIEELHGQLKVLAGHLHHVLPDREEAEAGMLKNAAAGSSPLADRLRRQNVGIGDAIERLVRINAAIEI